MGMTSFELLRTLSAMADGLDEHLALVRVADQEGFDIVQLQNSLTQFLACYFAIYPIPNPRRDNPRVEYKKGGPSEFVSKLLGTTDRILINFVVGPNNKNLLRLSKGPFLHMPYHMFLRFSDTIDYLFKDGGCWKTHGCYASMMLSPGFSILFKKKGIYHRPMQSIWRGHCVTNNGWTVEPFIIQPVAYPIQGKGWKRVPWSYAWSCLVGVSTPKHLAGARFPKAF